MKVAAGFAVKPISAMLLRRKLGCRASARTRSRNPDRLSPVPGLTKVAKTDDVGLLPQPLNPKYKTALVQIYVTNQPFGGSDKSASGHRYDSIPIANGMIASQMSLCLLILLYLSHFLEETRLKAQSIDAFLASSPSQELPIAALRA